MARRSEVPPVVEPAVPGATSRPPARLGTIQQRLDAFEARMPGARTARGMYQRDRSHAGSVLAAGLAFRLFLMLLPLFLLASSALGFLADRRGQAVSAVEGALGVPGSLAKVLSDSAGQAHEGRWLLLLTGLSLLVYTANSASRALRLVHVVAWQERAARAGPLAATLAGLLLIAMLAWGTVATAVDARFPYTRVPTDMVLIGLLGGTWLLLSMLLPHGSATWRALLPGAVVVAIALGTMHLVSSYYIPRKLSSTSQLYGALGAAATLMAWLFLACRVVVAATVLNALLWERGRVLGGASSRAMKS